MASHRTLRRGQKAALQRGWLLPEARNESAPDKKHIFTCEQFQDEKSLARRHQPLPRKSATAVLGQREWISCVFSEMGENKTGRTAGGNAALTSGTAKIPEYFCFLLKKHQSNFKQSLLF